MHVIVSAVHSLICDRFQVRKPFVTDLNELL